MKAVADFPELPRSPVIEWSDGRTNIERTLDLYTTRRSLQSSDRHWDELCIAVFGDLKYGRPAFVAQIARSLQECHGSSRFPT